MGLRRVRVRNAQELRRLARAVPSKHTTIKADICGTRAIAQSAGVGIMYVWFLYHKRFKGGSKSEGYLAREQSQSYAGELHGLSKSLWGSKSARLEAATFEGLYGATPFDVVTRHETHRPVLEALPGRNSSKICRLLRHSTHGR
jgi:hypothetical protein